MIEIRNVSHQFDGRPVLRNITLTLRERRIAVIGANGSGKSTFARTLNGLIIPDRGEVLVGGLSTRTDARAVRRKVGFVFQNPEHQIVMPTVEEDLAFGPRNLNLDQGIIAERVEALLAAHGLADKRSQPAHLLSGGEQRLLTLLSVVIMAPDHIVFDEPTASLDLAARNRMMALMRDLQQTVITITHDFEVIAGYDRALLFEDGAVIVDGRPDDVVRHYVGKVSQCSLSMSTDARPFTRSRPA